MKTTLIFLLGLIVGLLAYFGYTKYEKNILGIIKTPSIIENNLDSAGNNKQNISIGTDITQDGNVYKITFNKKEFWEFFKNNIDHYYISPEKLLATIFNISELKDKDFQEINKFLKLKENSVSVDNNQINYYLWLDKSIQKIDTSKKYNYRDLIFTIESESLSVKPYIFSDTYCKSDSDCVIGDGTGCIVGAINKYKEVFYGPTGCIAAHYPAEDQNFIAQEDAKCRDKSVNKDWASYLEISYSGASCVSNKCIPTGRKVSCLE